MAGLAYLYVPLETATLVQRKHPRDIVPPSMVRANNVYISRSDKSISVRPDLDVSADDLHSFAPVIQYAGTTNDYLNSAFGLYGSDNILWLTSSFPIGPDLILEKSSILSPLTTTVSSSALSISNDDNFIFTLSSNDEINALTDIWPGSYIEINDGSGDYYRISGVSTSLRFYVDTDPGTVTASTFSIHRPHNNLSGGYKANIQSFGSQVIYAFPTLTNNSYHSFISGPFYTYSADATSGSSDVTFTLDSSDTLQEYSPGYLLYGSNNNNICSTSNTPESTTRYFAMPSRHGIGEGVYFFIYTALQSEILAETGWSKVENEELVADNDYFSPRQLYFDGTTGWLVGSTYDADDTPVYDPVVHTFTNAATPVFTDVSDLTNMPDQPYCVVYDSVNETHVVGGYASSGTRAAVVYSDDDGATWTASTGVPAGYQANQLWFSSTDSIILGYFSTAYYWRVLQSADGGATWSNLAGPYGDGVTSFFHAPFGFYEDNVNWCLFYCDNQSYPYTLSYIFGGESSFSSTDSFNSFIYFYSQPMYDGTQYDLIIIGVSGSNFYSISINTTESTIGAAVSCGAPFLTPSGSSYVNASSPLPLDSTTWEERKYVSFGTPQGSASPDSLYQGILERTVETSSPADAVVDTFYPVSEIYRSNVFSILDGYLVLFGTTEYDEDNEAWEYQRRRVRWTAPNTINDFSGVGSGVGELTGNGVFIDARPVNGRIVTFESSCIGALVPRGIVADPWDYEIIHEGIKTISNPCVVKDRCYFVASDGLLYVTNGISVEEAGSSFDISLFDDFNDDSPVWLVYSPMFDSLFVFYPDGTDNVCYMINLATGSVSSMDLPTSSLGATNDPKSIVAVENSSDQRVFVSYNPLSTDADRIVLLELSSGDPVTGIDSMRAASDDHYWYSEIETGNIFIVDEGVKVALKHIIIHTYTDATAGTTDTPDIIIEVKSIEDSAYGGAGNEDLDGAVTVTNVACTISTTTPPVALTNLLGTANATAVTYNLPWIATNCRIFTKTGTTYTACTLVTTTPDAANEYQITGTQQIKVYGTAGHTVYCFCENEPFVRVEAGDYIESDEGLHRITGLTNYTTAALDRYKASGTYTTADHLAAEQMAAGHGQVKLGINRLVEGVQLKIRIVPRHAAEETDQPSVAKITGISLGYIPLGEKIVEATGG